MRIRRRTFARSPALLLLASIGAVASAYPFALSRIAHVAPKATIIVVAEGDSLTYGQDTTSQRTLPPINGAGSTRSVTPYTETLQRLLGPRYLVVNHGFPGDRTTEGLMRWADAPAGRIVILMYGTNDCMNYGGYSGALSIDEYTDNLRKLASRRSTKKASIIIVAPPPLADPGADRKCQPYRVAAQRVAHASGATFFAVPRMPGMWSDGVHLSPDGYTRIARGVRPLVQRLGQRR